MILLLFLFQSCFLLLLFFLHLRMYGLRSRCRVTSPGGLQQQATMGAPTSWRCFFSCDFLLFEAVRRWRPAASRSRSNDPIIPSCVAWTCSCYWDAIWYFLLRCLLTLCLWLRWLSLYRPKPPLRAQVTTTEAVADGRNPHRNLLYFASFPQKKQHCCCCCCCSSSSCLSYGPTPFLHTVMCIWLGRGAICDVIIQIGIHKYPRTNIGWISSMYLFIASVCICVCVTTNLHVDRQRYSSKISHSGHSAWGECPE